jgi:hypothetical protein
MSPFPARVFKVSKIQVPWIVAQSVMVEMGGWTIMISGRLTLTVIAGAKKETVRTPKYPDRWLGLAPSAMVYRGRWEFPKVREAIPKGSPRPVSTIFPNQHIGVASSQ